MDKKISFSVCGMPFKVFLPFALMVLIATYAGFMPTVNVFGTKSASLVMTIPFLMVVGGIFFWLGDTIPILNNYLGGACLLPLIGASFMNYVGLVPKTMVNGVKLLMGGGFQDMYISMVLVGSILYMDRKVILSATARYIPTVIGSQVFAILFAIGSSILFGFGATAGLFDVAAPCMSGGSGGAITTLPALYSSLSGTDMTTEAGKYLCYASIANVLAVVMAAIFGSIMAKMKGMNGHGQILQAQGSMEAGSNDRPATSADYKALAGGLLMSFALYVGGNIFGSLPVVGKIPGLAWTIIFAIIIKCTGMMEEKFENYSVYSMNFALRALLPMLIAGIGIKSLNFTSLTSYFSVPAFMVILITVFGAFVGAAFFGKLSGLWPYEAGVTAGLCCCNIGGSGDIAVLSAADRLNLLAFASISTRIGGALMVVWIGLLYPFFH